MKRKNPSIKDETTTEYQGASHKKAFKTAEKSNKEKRRFSVKTIVLTAVLSVLFGVILTVGAVYIGFGKSGFKIAAKLLAVHKLASDNYTGTIDENAVDKKVLSGYVTALEDEYAFYKSGQEAESVFDSLKGVAHGIGMGATYLKEEHCIQVLEVYENAPAQKAGIAAGDKIIAVDGKTVEKLGYKAAIAAIKKQDGKQTTLTVKRGEQTLTFKITCASYVPQTVYFETLENIGYIRITQFNDATEKQFKTALDTLLKQKVTGLVFDLRNNGGGTVDSAAEIIDRLVGRCNIISVKFKNGKTKVLFRSDENKVELPMAVITNGETASAAELFAAALRDEANATLVGSKTYGKGIMQSTYHLFDGSCVRMTVAEFFPPSGQGFHKIGIEPNVKLNAEQTKIVAANRQNDACIAAALQALKSAER